MSGSQIFVVCFGLIAAAVSIWAVWRVARSPHLRYKPLWIIGSLIGSVGFITGWSTPGDLFMSFGVQLPVVNSFTMLASGQVFIKAMFPLIAVVALVKSRPAKD